MSFFKHRNFFLVILLTIAFGSLGTWLWFHSRPGGPLSKVGPNQGSTEIKKYNRLGNEKSPYLLQHKDNPVQWFSWGKEALQAAREENKIIFLSIGYSTCYWCHMMEKESFERPEVAKALNRDFISIKVDREERPDLDQIYMDAVVKMGRRGGWPLSVFLTPELKPFFGGTYFPRQAFLKILSEVQEQWQDRPEEVLSSGERIAQTLEPPSHSRFSPPFKDGTLRLAYSQMERRYDNEYGGFGGAPKFPQSPRISFLLRVYQRTGNAEALKMATETLNKMARGGIYDHLGGGFHRYSTDKKWFSPHFEKMLYDNAQLAITYLEAFQVTQNQEYAEIARETLDYVLREMAHPEGAFFSAQDAGEVGKEGEYYVWKESELKEILTPREVQQIKKTYHVDPKGNFKNGENILYLSENEKWAVKNNPLLASAREKLLTHRNQRTPPHKDDKILTAWNGLMIAAMAKGYQVLGDPRYLAAAQNAATFLENKLVGPKGKLLRRYRDHDARFPGYLNDYAFLIYGLLELYQTDFNPHWLNWAIRLQKEQDKLFWDEEKGGYFFSQAGDESLILRKKESYDGAIPSGNSIATLNLLRLKDLTLNPAFKDRLGEQLHYLSGEISRYPASFPQALIAVDYFLDQSKEIAVVPGESEDGAAVIKAFLHSTFLPNKVAAIGKGLPAEDDKAQPGILRAKKALEGKTTIYVCEDNLCKEPLHDLEKAQTQIKEVKKYQI